jgi:hypothetical protein
MRRDFVYSVSKEVDIRWRAARAEKQERAGSEME